MKVDAAARSQQGKSPMRSKQPDFLKPGAGERIFGRVLVLLVRLGLVRGHFYVLEVRGRKSGRTFSLPVDPIEVAGRRYLVCARGNANWVRNARAAGEIALVRALRRHTYAVRELLPGERPPVLKAYLDRFAAEVQRFFPVANGSPVEAFSDLAQRYPVLELQPLGIGQAASREARADPRTNVLVEAIERDPEQRRQNRRNDAMREHLHLPGAGQAQRVDRRHIHMLDRLGEETAEHADRTATPSRGRERRGQTR